MDLFFNVDGVGTETGLADAIGCVVSVDVVAVLAMAVARNMIIYLRLIIYHKIN